MTALNQDAAVIADRNNPAEAEDRVPWNQLIAYGMGGLIPIALFNIAGQLMGLLGNISLGLSAVWLGFIMIVPRLWDAISDPLMGHLSDNTRSSWGRRRPYILFGGIAVALSFVAMWWVPRGDAIKAILQSEHASKWLQIAFIAACLMGLGVVISILKNRKKESAYAIEDRSNSFLVRHRSHLIYLALLGAVISALAFIVVRWDYTIGPLLQNDSAPNWFQLVFILAGLLVFFTSCTVFEIPHGALGMEMSSDYHERTRLFSAKSFLGNLFAMGTPWLIFLAGLEVFSGPGGDLIDGMRYVSIFIAIALIPMTFWWFYSLKEPGFQVTKEQKKTAFWSDMRTTTSNRTFLNLVAIIFTLAMGFNFVGLFNYYITIFYLFDGNAIDAGTLLGINGTFWAVTGLVAVFPLNWLSRKFGKSKTLIIAILLMCSAQLTKIVCYQPSYPYLIIIPTVLLSSGMLMFFTLGSSMVGDICDEDELKTGTRSEGSYYSVYWWFIKMGTAFASFVTGILLVYTSFDETQNVSVDGLSGSLISIRSETEKWSSNNTDNTRDWDQLSEHFKTANDKLDELENHLNKRLEEFPEHGEHSQKLLSQLKSLRSHFEELERLNTQDSFENEKFATMIEKAAQNTGPLKKQSPLTLYRLRFVEIGLPLVLSLVSISLTLYYPLTEARCYEIKEALERRHSNISPTPS